jgi:formylglycine-generating enzyme required for sulfatase activity
LLVRGGAFYRGYDGVVSLSRDYPATVSDFYLDKYEVTVGRLRVFVNAGRGTQKSPPGDGAGAHPKIPGSGWSPAWNTKLPASTAALKTALKCNPHHQTWMDTPGSNESKAVNCLDWYTAFAFCAWDGGRLATEAEWHYAASGGSEQRFYPWSSPPTSKRVDDSYAVYSAIDGNGGPCRMQNVGSKSPKGDGKWGQSDLAGNAWEWTFDWAEGPYPMPCHDCAGMTAGRYRTYRGGSNHEIAEALRSVDRHVFNPEARFPIGARCARTP